MLTSTGHLREEALPGDFAVVAVHGLRVDVDPLDTDCRRLLRDLLTRCGVLCLRLTEKLDDAAFQRVVSMFGTIKDPIARDGNGDSLRYSPRRQVIDAGYILPPAQRGAGDAPSYGGDSVRPGLFEFFHTDDSYVEAPALATALHARALPPSGGGNTCFMDMRAALRMLTAKQRRRLVGLRAVHAYNNRGAFPPRAAATGALEALRAVAHPIVRAHPRWSEPALYFDLDRATHIEGLPIVEGRALLQELQDFAERVAPKYAHVWAPHDVLLWDNVCVQHRASGDFPLGEPRRFWRYLIEGPVPIAAAA
jgi:alpha-ketoglutarate-dependent taurine dioxygenase